MIYFGLVDRNDAIDVQIPICTMWRRYGRTIIGSALGQRGTNSTFLNLPTAILAVGDDDTFYFVDSGNNRLMKYEGRSSIGKQVIIQTNARHRLECMWTNMEQSSWLNQKNIELYDDHHRERKSKKSLEREMSALPFHISIVHRLFLWIIEIYCTWQIHIIIEFYVGDKMLLMVHVLSIVLERILHPTDRMRSFSILQIILSSIVITLLLVGISKFSLGYNENYTFSPNASNYDIDREVNWHVALLFNSNFVFFQNVHFVYYCRKYPQFGYTTINGSRISIDKDGQNPRNSTCFDLKGK